MGRLIVGCFILAVGSLTLAAGEPSKSDEVKKLAESLVAATIKADYAKVIDHTYDGIVKELGGKDAAVKSTETVMKQMKGQGFTITSFKVGEPGDFVTEGDNTFVVLPTTMAMTFPKGKIVAKSYLLGISSDVGKTWKFADGSGIENKQIRAKVLPKLPEKLKLPEFQAPEITKD